MGLSGFDMRKNVLEAYFAGHDLPDEDRAAILENLPGILQASVDFIYAQWQCCDVESALTMFFPAGYKTGRTDEKIGMMLEIQKTVENIWKTEEQGQDMPLDDFQLQVMGKMIDFSR